MKVVWIAVCTILILASVDQIRARKDTCSRVRCGYSKICRVVKGRALCICRRGCPKILRPVCGSDGKTYDNECLLRVARCVQNKFIKVIHKGPCRNPCAVTFCGFGAVCRVKNGKAVCVCNSACPFVYKPVCGSDGKTYSNECNLNSARCKQKKFIRVIHEGPCKNPCSGKRCRYGGICKVLFGKAVCVCRIACTKIYLPVCGSDRKTYSNECMLKRARCQQQKFIWVSYKGPCKKNPCSGKRCRYGGVCKVLFGKAVCVCRIACTKIYRPVCGSDRKTYSNECMLKRAQCQQQKLIWVSYKGPCKKNPCSGKRCRYGGVCKVLFGKAVCVCRIACTKIYRPVCGSDRKTYSNECMLKRARCQQQKFILVSYKGRCKKNPCSGKRCRYGGVCKVQFGKAACVCHIACIAIYRPVCGSDRKTYSNECVLKRARCQQQKLIWVSYKGRCKKNPCFGKRCGYGRVCKVILGKAVCVCRIACTKIYRPVCGSDRKTYTNECALKRARCLQRKLIWVSYKGPCKKW